MMFLSCDIEYFINFSFLKMATPRTVDSKILKTKVATCFKMLHKALKKSKVIASQKIVKLLKTDNSNPSLLQKLELCKVC